MSDWTELGVELPTDEMLQNWREANEYTNEGEEDHPECVCCGQPAQPASERCVMCDNCECPDCWEDHPANGGEEDDGLPGLKFEGVPTIAEIEAALTGYSADTHSIAMTVFNALRETIHHLADVLDVGEGREHWMSRDARSIVRLSEGLWTEVEELLT